MVQRFYDRALVELQRSAAEAIAELSLPLRAQEIASAADEPDAPPDFSVYDAAGLRLYGAGPDRLDTIDRDQLVVVSPVTDRSTEAIVGSVRVSRSRSAIAGAARRAWGSMLLAAVGGLGLAFVVARREAARLVAPIAGLAERAQRLGGGAFDVTSEPTGTPEFDVLAEALALSARRLAELVAREREFSANASHQLRTPLAGLRVSLERGDLDEAALEAERLTATVDHLLAFSRGSLPTTTPTDLAPVLESVAGRWMGRIAESGRQLRLVVNPRLTSVAASAASIEQALDVLVDNAVRHGGGEIRLTARPAAGGVVVEIEDDGPGIAPALSARIFQRHEGSGTGIGLALARTLVEADGGRLLLVDPERAGFHIVYASGTERLAGRLDL
ncbi:MAG: HAMP domain-containing sensor histidine kinase [Ilumatobacteraceae bacterium]